MLKNSIRTTGWVMLTISLVLSLTGCGGGGGSDAPLPPSDTTPPVTTAYPVGGFFNSIQQVTLTANEAATIYYSMDGNAPSVGGGNTTSGNSPIAGITIPEGTTILKFFAIDLASNNESVKTETYTINLAAPIVSLIGGTPSPIGLLDAVTINWESNENGTYIIEVGGNGAIGSGTQILSGSVQSSIPVASHVQGINLSFAVATPLWVYVTDSLGGTGSIFVDLNLKPLETIVAGNTVSNIKILQNGLKAYITSKASDNVIVIDTDPSSGTYNTIVATIPVGISPTDIAFTPDDSRAYITNEGRTTIDVDSISEILTATDTVTDTIPLGSSAPNGIAITPDGTRAYFLSFDGKIYVLDIDITSVKYNTVVDSISRSLLLFGEIAITPDGNKAVTNWQGSIAHAVDVYDVELGSMTYNQLIASPIPVISGLRGDVALSNDSAYAYVSSSYFSACGVCKVDLQTNSILAKNSTDFSGLQNALAVTPDGVNLIAGGLNDTTLSLFSTTDISYLGNVDIGTNVRAMDITSDGSRAYVVESDISGSYKIIMVPLL